MENSKDTNPKAILIFFVASVIFYIFAHGRGFVRLDYGFFWPVLVGGLILSGQAIIWRSRYQMPHLVLNGFSGSVMGRPDPVRDVNGKVWAIFNTGEYLDPVHGRGKLASVVVPWNQIHRAGQNYVGLTLVSKIPFALLPSFVNSYLRYNKDRFNLEKIYFGYVSEDFVHENSSFEDLQEEIKALNARINSQRMIIEGKNDELVDQIELNRKITGKEHPILNFLRRNPDADRGVRE